MASQQAPPAGGDVDRAPAIIAIAWVETALSILIVAARFRERKKAKSIGADDWVMLFALCLFISWSSVVTYYASLGGVRHLYYLMADKVDFVRLTILNYVLQSLTVFSFAPAKTSVAILVMRLIGGKASSKHSWRKWLVYVTMTLVWIATIINTLTPWVQCNPPRALWDPSVPHECWDPTAAPNYANFTGSLNVFADAVLAFIPASTVYGLNMDIRKRISLCVLLSLGIIAAICGIVKMKYLSTMAEHSDITWQTYDLFVWSGSELFVLIFCGSIPPLKGLFDSYLRNRKGYFSSNASGQYATGSTFNSSANRQESTHGPFAKDSSIHTTVRTGSTFADGTELSSPGHAKGTPRGLKGSMDDGIHLTTDIEMNSYSGRTSDPENDAPEQYTRNFSHHNKGYY